MLENEIKPLKDRRDILTNFEYQECARAGRSTLINIEPIAPTIELNRMREMWFSLLLGDLTYHAF